MPVQAQSVITIEGSSKTLCRKCRAPNLRRRTATFFNAITSFYPYTCGRCGHHQKRFRFTIVTFVVALMAGTLAGGAVWFGWHPPSFLGGEGNATDPARAQQDQAEALARARTSAGGQLSTFEQLMVHKQKTPMDNATILKLVKANVGKDIILQMIRTSGADYDLGANAIIELKDAGVDQAVILAMIDVSYASH